MGSTLLLQVVTFQRAKSSYDKSPMFVLHATPSAPELPWHIHPFDPTQNPYRAWNTELAYYFDMQQLTNIQNFIFKNPGITYHISSETHGRSHFFVKQVQPTVGFGDGSTLHGKQLSTWAP